MPRLLTGAHFFVGFSLSRIFVSASFSGKLPPVVCHVLARLTGPDRHFFAGDLVFKLDLLLVWACVCPAGEACSVRAGLFVV